jgi:hypothetical protein
MDMEVDFDSHFITDGGDIRDMYFISQSWYIIDYRYEYEITHEEDSAWVISQEEVKIEARPYSDKEFMKIICSRLENWLNQIWWVNIKSNTTDNKITTSFQLDYLNQNEYRDFLLSFVETEIGKLHPVMSLDWMRKGMINTIRKLSEQFESNTIILSETDIAITINSKDELRNKHENNIVQIFEIYIPASINELLIYLFIYEWKIESFKLIDGNHYSLVLSEETSLFKPRVVGPIHFDKQNWVITLHWDEVGILNKDTRYYQLFEILYDRYNTLLNPDKICSLMQIKKTGTGAYDHVRWIKADLKDSGKLPKDFIDKYIEIRNWLFILSDGASSPENPPEFQLKKE